MVPLATLLEKDSLTASDMAGLLSLHDKSEVRRLYNKAYAVKRECVGTTVYFRGLIEISNLCEKNCYYCGIRRENGGVERYMMDETDILDAAGEAWKWGYGSVVLQSGEISGDHHARFIERIILKIKKLFHGELGITLSLGEQDEDAYRRWRQAGAHRYLLRIETSDRRLYSTLHPEDHSYDRRIECLSLLKTIGYQVGTGVMIGLPGQTVEQLAQDILFYKRIDADMIGMGPYIPHHGTPLAKSMPDFDNVKAEQLDLSLRMIAVTRIVLRDVNIAATTALQAIGDSGRELGLKAGANVIMPNITPLACRVQYELYDDKPCLDENEATYRSSLEARIESIGETIGYGRMGNSPHFKDRIARERFAQPAAE